jgi:RNA polymerase sigma-70 factor (ECF subfamily)
LTGTEAAERAVAPDQDELLVRRFQQTGDAEAFHALVRRHLPAVRRLLAVILGGDREEVQDAEQEVLLSLYRRLGSFQFRSSFRTFLYSLARNRAVDHLRRLRRHARIRERARLQAPPPGGAGTTDPLARVLEQERRQDLWRAFSLLPVGQRQLLLMKEVEGFAVEEIAGILALPEGTVKSRLHRGRARLARLLRGES